MSISGCLPRRFAGRSSASCLARACRCRSRMDPSAGAASCSAAAWSGSIVAGRTASVHELAFVQLVHQLATPGPWPRIAFLDQDVPRRRPARGQCGQRSGDQGARSSVDRAGAEQLFSRCLARAPKRRSASHFACPISAASMPEPDAPSSERMVSLPITISAAAVAARVVIVGFVRITRTHQITRFIE